MRRDKRSKSRTRTLKNFYSRASCEARLRDGCTLGYDVISTHAPRVRRDDDEVQDYELAEDFYSRASCEARLSLNYTDLLLHHFYSRASCEARPGMLKYIVNCVIFLLTRLV